MTNPAAAVVAVAIVAAGILTGLGRLDGGQFLAFVVGLGLTAGLPPIGRGRRP